MVIVQSHIYTLSFKSPCFTQITCCEGHLQSFLGRVWQLPPWDTCCSVVVYIIDDFTIRTCIQFSTGPRWFHTRNYIVGNSCHGLIGFNWPCSITLHTLSKKWGTALAQFSQGLRDKSPSRHLDTLALWPLNCEEWRLCGSGRRKPVLWSVKTSLT